MAKLDLFGDTVNVTPASMRKFSEALRELAARHDAIAEWMERDSPNGIRAKNLKTAVTALAQLGKFAGAVTTATCDQISAAGIADLEGAVAVLNRYLKRTSESLNDLESREAEKSAILEEAKRAAVEPQKRTAKRPSRNES